MNIPQPKHECTGYCPHLVGTRTGHMFHLTPYMGANQMSCGARVAFYVEFASAADSMLCNRCMKPGSRARARFAA